MNIATLGSFVVAALALLLSVISTVKNGTKEYAVEMSKMTMELTKTTTEMREISDDVKEIKNDFRREMEELRVAYRSDHDRLIKMELSLDTAWKRIDELRQRGG